jgi:hypothetical protein
LTDLSLSSQIYGAKNLVTVQKFGYGAKDLARRKKDLVTAQRIWLRKQGEANRASVGTNAIANRSDNSSAARGG